MLDITLFASIKTGARRFKGKRKGRHESIPRPNTPCDPGLTPKIAMLLDLFRIRIGHCMIVVPKDKGDIGRKVYRQIERNASVIIARQGVVLSSEGKEHV